MSCAFFKVNSVSNICGLPVYSASTITGHTVYFTKRTGHLKMSYSQRNYILNLEKIEEKAFLNVLCVL